jgi:hypothetical protein
MKPSYRDQLENNEVDLLKAELDKCYDIISSCYQLAGLVDAPLVWFDVLSDPKNATQKQIDQMLPITYNDVRIV